MENMITGAFALALLVVYLGYYLIKIGSLPLSAIILAVLAMASYDFFKSLRDGTRGDK